MVKGHGQAPRSLPVLALRIGLALLVLLAIVWATQWRQRISGADLQHDLAVKLRAAPARWACLVGAGPAQRCVVSEVSIIGAWTLEKRPSHCRYP